MKKEYLFRAKNIKTGEWEYGFYLEAPLDPSTTDETTKHRYMILSDDGTLYNVDPDTVGQWIGKLDSNGKKIFEGDIIRQIVGDTTFESPVIYQENYCRYIAKVSFLSVLPQKCYIIGNIYGKNDTPITDIHRPPSTLES